MAVWLCAVKCVQLNLAELQAIHHQELAKRACNIVKVFIIILYSLSYETSLLEYPNV